MMPARRAMTIVEVVLAMVVVSTMLVGALYAVAASAKTTAGMRDRATAAALADDLLGYICRLAYRSPSGSILGLEIGNILGDKTTYDDVDDFDGYKESPPQDSDGKVIPDLTGWSREATVEFVVATDPATVSGADTGVKRVTVVVKKGGAVLARRVALRTNLSSASD